MDTRSSTLYTGHGDDGTTSLANGQRLAKGSLRIEALGTIHELNALLGCAGSHELPDALKKTLLTIQRQLFSIGAYIALDRSTRLDPAMIEQLEEQLDRLDGTLPALRGFLIPGGSVTAGLLHHASAVCRRAERRLWQLAGQEPEEIDPTAPVYLNRLSDLLFVMAREANRATDHPEVLL